jgi:Fic-DOC domain mobile mystery protein B
MRFVYPEGATPVDPDEAQALIPGHITIQSELNEWESQNIQKAVTWGLSRKRTGDLTAEFVRELHRRMFDQTWEWAGAYRRSDKNIGVPWEQVAVGVHKLLRDADVWLRESVYSVQESAIRLHHRVVAIHPFVNGNGRHARLLADVLLYNRDLPRIEWGGSEIDKPGAPRFNYLQALRAADQGDYALLLSYVSR